MLSIFAAGVLARLFFVQCLGHEVWIHHAVDQHRRLGKIPARRGNILDSRGSVLSCSVDSPSLYAVPLEVDDPAAAAALLAPALDLDYETIRARLDSDRSFTWIKRHLSPGEKEAVEALNLPGLGFRVEKKRVYPKGTMLSNVLGLTDVDGNGIEGLEAMFDRQLRGRDGWRLTERDRMLREAVWFRIEDIPPVDGCSLVLTVDEVIQDIAEDELRQAVAEHEAAWGTALVMDCRTGDVLALANLPDFDPNRFPRPAAGVRRNRAITDPIEPGSTFKVFAGAAALEAGVVTPETSFYCENGSFRIGGVVLHDSHPLGTLTFAEIIRHSSNIGMAKVGMLLGEDDLYRTLKRFLVGEKTGIQLPGESAGILRPVGRWSKISLRSITMGHEVSLTPLGLLIAFAAFGNDGIVPAPRLVKRIETADGAALRSYPVSNLGRAVAAATAAEMLEILTTVVEEDGTGSRARIPGYRVAGKTGTAQKPGPDGTYSHRLYRSLFMGMFPAGDSYIAILVMLDEPQGAYYGGTVAAPAFKRIGERIIRYLQLPPSEETA
ncbi:MAG TPA: penicillin-binding protein 2 [bacterium]|nr:penicillin-binding protein 2 [bacterium]HPJ71194.1 penicillin-binding protein 2 [bacterium]HPQ66961.1 penicillin-binding protein 2 [bacterium]